MKDMGTHYFEKLYLNVFYIFVILISLRGLSRFIGLGSFLIGWGWILLLNKRTTTLNVEKNVKNN